MRRWAIIFAAFVTIASPAMGASELAKINAQIKQTEQQDKKLAQQVKTSERDVAATKKKLVRAADQVSTLEEKRGASRRFRRQRFIRCITPQL